MTKPVNPLHLKHKIPLLGSIAEAILGLKPLAQTYDLWLKKTVADNAPVSEQFLDHVLDSLETSFNVIDVDNLLDIPAQGSFVAFANHPFGGLEGMQLARLLMRYRPDLKVLTNEVLTLFPEFSDLFIGVDVLSKNSTTKNVSGMKQLSAHLKKGGAVLIFPAGIVAGFDLREQAIVEKPWTPMLGRLIRKYQADCLAIHVEGHNSLGFHLLGLIHRRLRTAMLARELTNKKGHCTKFVSGKVLKKKELQQKELQQFKDDQVFTEYLRLNCDSLALKNRTSHPALNTVHNTSGYDSSRLLLEESLAGMEDCLLLSRASFKVYCAPYQRLGAMASELARIRELTFRAAGEGTGNSEDSDCFDPHYLHLFVWDERAGKLVGAYRMGKCDEILSRFGVKGLYSRSLFTYKRQYIERLGGALEVGRSFVSSEYQRNPRALDMLWRGIGTFVARNPQYHTLFGCVSISSEHSDMARAFLSETMLTSFAAAPEFLTDIKPLSPLRVKGKLWSSKVLASLSDIVVINKLVGHFAPGKSIPVLLRHYLALNGRFVSFSVNHGFNQALDGLILVDLRNSPLKYLQRYLGHEGAEQFLKEWESNEAAA